MNQRVDVSDLEVRPATGTAHGRFAGLSTLPEVQKIQIQFWHSTNSDWSFNMAIYEKFFLLFWTM